MGSTAIRAAAQRRNAVRWTIGAALGLRQGEVLALQWTDADFDAATLTIRRQLQRQVWRHGCADPDHCRKRGADCQQRHGGGIVAAEPKSRAGRRVISLPASLLLELAAHRKAQIAERLAAPYWEDHGLVFATEWGAPIDQRRDWAEFKQLLTAAGLRDARVHDLRHSAATLMLEADTDLQTAGQILGHGSITQTSQYTHILADRRRAAAARIESLLWGQPASEAVRASTATGDELLPELLPGVSARSTRPTRTPKTRGLRGGQGQDRTVDLPLFRRRRGVHKRRGTS